MTTSKKNPRVDAYLGRATKWREEMGELREIILDCGLMEDLKWGKPCYAFEEGNVVIIQPFKAYCALLFFKGVLLKDPKKILVKTGENTHVGRQIRLNSAREIAEMESVLKAYLRQAIEVEKSGLKVPEQKNRELPLPEELRRKLNGEPAFKKAFQALTPGRQRGYIYYFSGAKQSATRESRIEKCLPQILQGRGLNE